MALKLDTHCPLSVRVDALEAPVFPPPSLKFRTVGFPQYGFKREVDADLHPCPTRSSARPAYPRRTRTYTTPKLPSPAGAAQRANRNGIQRIQAVLRPSADNTPVQRPLAHQWVMLSHRITAYYGLIRHSRPLRSIYGLVRAGFARRSCLGWCRELPQFNLHGCPYVPPSLPRWTEWLHAVVPWPSVLAFAHSVGARRPQSTHAGTRVVPLTRLQSSLNATARRFASPTPA